LRILGDRELPSCARALLHLRFSERWNRKPLKMKLPHEELTTRQLIRHMRDAIHREEW
jgi:hypothetical protein